MIQKGKRMNKIDFIRSKMIVVKTVMTVFCLIFLVGFMGVSVSAEVVPAEITYQNPEPTPTVQEITMEADGDAYNVTKIKMNYSGVLQIKLSKTALFSDNVDIESILYSDIACTQVVSWRDRRRREHVIASGGFIHFPDFEGNNVYKFVIPSAGTYYLKSTYLYNHNSSESKNVFKVEACAYNGDAKKLGKDYKLTYTNDYYDKKVYHKFVVKDTQVVTISGKALELPKGYGFGTELCNKKKKVLREISFSHDETSEDLVLKKGTYYLSVREDGPYILKVEPRAEKVKNEAGASKKKAKLIKKGKTLRGYLALTDSWKKQYWYKIKLNKDMKFKLSVKSKVSSLISADIMLSVETSDGKTIVYTEYFNSSTQILKSLKLKKGTYYIRVEKFASKASGVFSIKNLTK